MKPENLFHVDLYNVFCLVCSLHRNKMCNFCSFFHHNHDGIMLLHSFGQLCNEINRNHFPFPLRNGKWLQKTCWMSMLCLYLLAFQTSNYVISHFFLHSRPKVLDPYNCNVFLISWVPNIWHIVHFSQHCIFQLHGIWHIHLASIQEDSNLF